MQLPLLHRSTQMAVLKKLIRRKVREVRWRRQRAQRRLEIMRHIRWELLKLMQHLIDLRQRDAGQERRQQARRSVSGMLHMYKRWLGNWTRAIKNHGQLIRQQEQEKRRLNSRLRLLRKRLRKHRRPRHLVDRCLEKLAKAVKRWQRRPDYHQFFESQKLIWAQEAEEVRRYLADIRGKSPKRRKSYRRKSLGLHIDLQNFGSFWKFEVLRKKRKLGKIQAPSQGPPPEWTVYRIPKRPLRYRRIRKNKPINKTIHFNPGELDAENEPISKRIQFTLDADKKHKRRRVSSRKPSENDPLGPSLKEMQQLFQQLTYHNPAEQKVITALRSNVLKSKYAKKPKLVDEQISDDLGARKPKLSSLDEKIIKALEALKMNRDPSPRVSKESKELQESLDPLTSHKHARKSKSGDEKIGKPMDDLKVDNKGRKVVETKDLWDTSDLLHSSTTPQKKIQKKRKSKRGLSSQSSEDDSDLMMKKLTKRKHKYEKSASVEASVTNSAASLSESVKKLVMENDPRRKFIRKSIGFGLPHADFQPKPRTERSRKSVHGRRSVFKESLRKDYKDSDKSGDSADFKEDHQRDDQNVSPTGGIMDYPDGQKPDNTARRLGPSVVFIADVKIEDPERSNSDPEIDDQRSNQDIKKTGEDQDKSKTSKNQNKDASLEQTRNLKNIDLDLLPQLGKFGSLTGSASEVEAMSDLGSVYNESTASFPRKYNIKNLKSNAKYRPIQYFLKDVIESNPILDHAPNVQGLMQAVGKHYMWDHLTDFHNELLAGGISKHDIKRLLTEKYLTYLKIIRKGKLPADKKADSGSLASGYASNTHSQMDHLRNLRFWSRARLTSRLFHFGNQGENETQSQVTLTVPKPDNATLQQQLKAERIKKDDERLRRLLPTSQISTSLSATSSMMWEVASEEEEDLRQIEERYSIENLNRMMTEHKLRFQSSQEKSSQEKCCQDKVDSKYKLMVEHSDSPLEQPPPKRPSTQTSKSRDGQPLRPIQQLFYSPRKTCREQQIIKLYSEGSSDEQEEGNQEDQDSGTEMCPKCGVKVDIPYSIPSPKASSAILSSGSIEACAKNELLVNTMVDVCTRCGYVHNEANPCTQPPEDQRKTVVLRLIK
ncbi:hypothetical protein KR059_006347, partial [Drosophila kikkawai]